MLGTRQDFGFALYMIGGQPDTMGDGYPELMELALERGYFWWRFAPAQGREPHIIKAWATEDPTIMEDGTRTEAFPGYHPGWLLELAKSFETIEEIDDSEIKEALALHYVLGRKTVTGADGKEYPTNPFV